MTERRRNVRRALGIAGGLASVGGLALLGRRFGLKPVTIARRMKALGRLRAKRRLMRVPEAARTRVRNIYLRHGGLGGAIRELAWRRAAGHLTRAVPRTNRILMGRRAFQP